MHLYYWILTSRRELSIFLPIWHIRNWGSVMCRDTRGRGIWTQFSVTPSHALSILYEHASLNRWNVSRKGSPEQQHPGIHSAWGEFKTFPKRVFLIKKKNGHKIVVRDCWVSSQTYGWLSCSVLYKKKITCLHWKKKWNAYFYSFLKIRSGYSGPTFPMIYTLQFAPVSIPSHLHSLGEWESTVSWAGIHLFSYSEPCSNFSLESHLLFSLLIQLLWVGLNPSLAPVVSMWLSLDQS